MQSCTDKKSMKGAIVDNNIKIKGSRDSKGSAIFKKYFCILESFNRNISYHLFDYIITFVNSQHLNTNLEGDFVIKKPVLNIRFKDFGYTKLNLTQIWYEEFN